MAGQCFTCPRTFQVSLVDCKTVSLRTYFEYWKKRHRFLPPKFCLVDPIPVSRATPLERAPSPRHFTAYGQHDFAKNVRIYARSSPATLSNPESPRCPGSRSPAEAGTLEAAMVGRAALSRAAAFSLIALAPLGANESMSHKFPKGKPKEDG